MREWLQAEIEHFGYINERPLTQINNQFRTRSIYKTLMDTGETFKAPMDYKDWYNMKEPERVKAVEKSLSRIKGQADEIATLDRKARGYLDDGLKIAAKTGRLLPTIGACFTANEIRTLMAQGDYTEAGWKGTGIAELGKDGLVILGDSIDSASYSFPGADNFASWNLRLENHY